MTPTPNNAGIWKITTIALTIMLSVLIAMSGYIWNNLDDQVDQNAQDIRTIRECQVRNESDLSHITSDLAEIKALLKELRDKISP